MNLKQSVFIAASLDGFIARPDGGIDWLYGNSPAEEEQDHGYEDFISSVDALVMGRHTFEKVLTFEQWPYELPVVVLTSRSIELPDHLNDKVAVTLGQPKDIVEQLSEQGYNHLYIDGGKTIQQFLRAGLIQEMTITRIPVLLGEGIPLFGQLEQDIRLQHVKTITFENGFVQSKYQLHHGQYN